MEAREDAPACNMTRRLRHGISFFLERNDEPGSCRARAAHIYSMAETPGHPGRPHQHGSARRRHATVVTAPGGVESDVELPEVARHWLIADF
jgi:hypothetical protein